MAGARLVVMGASAGALEALGRILPSLPADYPVPILLVVHLPPEKDSMLAGLLDAKCQLRVKEAEDKEAAQAGCVYVAPPDYHLLIEKDLIISLSNEEEVQFSRPSIDVLFEAAADSVGAGAVAVVLTGGNEDGARGAQAIMKAGGVVLVQEPQTAYCAAMPEAARSFCPQARVLELDAMASELREVARPC